MLREKGTGGKPCLGSVSRDEVVHSLLFTETGNRGQHSESVAAEQDEILGVGSNTGDPGVVNVVDGVGSSCVLSYSTAVSKIQV